MFAVAAATCRLCVWGTNERTVDVIRESHGAFKRTTKAQVSASVAQSVGIADERGHRARGVAQAVAIHSVKQLTPRMSQKRDLLAVRHFEREARRARIAAWLLL